LKSEKQSKGQQITLEEARAVLAEKAMTDLQLKLEHFWKNLDQQNLAKLIQTIIWHFLLMQRS